MRTQSLTKALMAAMVLWALPALPGPDTYLVGNGQDVAKTIDNVSGGTVINSYAQVKAPLAPGDMTIRTSRETNTPQGGSSPPLFSGPGGGSDPGDLVMIIQTTGLVPAAAAGSAIPIDLEDTEVGRWELARLTNVNRSTSNVLTLTLDRPLKYSYAADVTQVVRVPEYATLTLEPDAVLRAREWDSATNTGGVLAFLSAGEVVMGAGSKLSAKGAGFRGGKYERDKSMDGSTPVKGCPDSGQPASTRAYSGEGLNADTNSPRGVDNVANGGGGGVCLKAGGGGGGNAGAGGFGGRSDAETDGGRDAAAGQGGTALHASPLRQLLLGGGGGAGHGRSQSPTPTPNGGHGGGIIFVRALSLTGSGTLDASGSAGGASSDDGAGGGGAGGTIHVRFLSQTMCSASSFLDVRGGNGGDTTHVREDLRGPGGGGGGGRVLFQSQGTTTCAFNVSSGLGGLARANERHGATPASSGFPYAGTATIMGSAFAAPAPPVIVDPSSSVTTYVQHPTLSGTGTPNTEVVIYGSVDEAAADVEYGRGAVGPTGNFSITLSRPLISGKSTSLVAVTEAQGLQGGPSDKRIFTVDTEAPETRFAQNGVPASPSNRTTVTFVFESNETAGIIYQCQVLEGNDTTAPSSSSVWPACSNPYSTTTTLEDATTYTMWVRAVDAAGNVDQTPARYAWLVDLTSPTTDFESGGTPGEKSNLANPEFRFTSDDVNASYECILEDSGLSTTPQESDPRWVACANPYVVPTRDDGSENTLWVRAKDAAGNVDVTPKSFTWTVDLTPPETNFTGTLPAPLNNLTSVIFTFESTEDEVAFECSLNGAPFSACQSGDSIGTPGNNTAYTLLVRAKDEAGNVDPTPAAYSWRTDKESPDTKLHSWVGKLSNAKRAGFDFNSPDEDVVGFQCILVSPWSTNIPEVGHAEWQACSASYLTPELAHGTYTLWVRAVDAAGNVDESPDSWCWSVDLEAPKTTLSVKPAPLTGELTARFEFSSDDDFAVFQCSYDRKDFIPCTSPYVLPNEDILLIAEGEHSMLIRAVDKAGNREEMPANHIWTVVVGEIETRIINSPAAVTRSTTATFEFESNLSNVTFICKLDEEARSDCDKLATFPNLSEGGHILSVVAKEGEREDSSPAVFSWTVDLTGAVPPTLTSPASDGTYFNTRRPTFAGQAPEDGTLIIRLNGQLVGARANVVGNVGWTFPLELELADGVYDLAVSLTDKAGNDGQEAARTFIVDATKPETHLTALPPALTNQPQAVFQFDSNEEGTTFECSLNDASFSPCTGANSHEVTVGDARHTFVVRAIDRAGNIADVRGEHTWRVDSVPPSTNIVEKPDADTNETQVVFRFESDEAPVWFECSINGNPFESCLSPFAWDGVPEGEHRLEVRARDEASNEDKTPAVHVWRVDTTPPAVPVVSAPAPDAVVGSLTPTFQGSAEPGSEVLLYIDGLDFGSVRVEPSGQWRLTLTRAISEGDHTVSALARDVAGNVGERSVETGFKVDPSINIAREVSSRGGGLSCATGGEGSVPLLLLGWGGLMLMAARRRRV